MMFPSTKSGPRGLTRVLRVIQTAAPEFGGPASGMWASIDRMADRAVSTDVLTLDSNRSGEPRGRASLITVGRPRTRWRFVPGARRWLRANLRHYDAVVVHGLWHYGTLVVRKECKRARIPYVVFVHGSLDPWFGRAQPLRLLRRYPFWLVSDYWALRDASRVLFTAEDECRLARGSIKPFPKIRSEVVRYGAEDLAIEGSPSLAGRPGTRDATGICDHYLLYLGRMHPKKGLDLLIEAYATVGAERLPRLVLAGPDPAGYLARLQARDAWNAVRSRIDIRGMVVGDERAALVSGASAMILPSHTENFGLVLAEAASCGVPLLTTNKVNIHGDIAAAGAGIIADDTLAGTIELLNGWLKLADAERAQMAINARALYDDRLSAEIAAESLEMVLREVIDETVP